MFKEQLPYKEIVTFEGFRAVEYNIEGNKYFGL